MKKKILLIFMAMMVNLYLFNIISFAASSGTCGTNLTWSLKSGTLTISGTGDMYTWSSSSNPPWYDSKANISKVVIDDGVTSIGSYAFNYCSNLTSITIPNSVICIGECALYNTAYYGDNSNWENNVLYIGKHLIKANTTISGSYNIKNGTITIANEAFSDCSKIENITIPESVTNIGWGAFRRCHQLATITIPTSVKKIDRYAFDACSNLKKVEISDISAWCEVDFDPYYANPLIYAKNLYLNGNLVTNLIIPNNVTTIGNYAFESCSSLTSIIIPDSVTSIGASAFFDCSSLTSVTIGDAVTSIGSSAFSDCNNLKRVEISDVSAWCKISFANSDSNPVYYSEDLYLKGELLTNLIIPDDVTTIRKYAFINCGSIENITIPDSIMDIEYDAFRWCYNLKKVEISDISAWCKISFKDFTSNPLFYARELYLDGNLLTNLIIPDDVTTIGDYVFVYCFSLINIIIPDSVTSIGSYAFGTCINLVNITIPDSVTSIGSSAFNSCESLTSITIPDSVTNIGWGAFKSCKSLTSITIPDSVTSIGSSMFEYCSNLTSITIPDSVTSIGSSAFAYCTNFSIVRYNGNEERWNKISINSYNNDKLINASKKYFYYVSLFNKEENKLDKVMVDKDSPLNVANIVVLVGYDLVLYKDEDFNERYDVNTPITENLTLYVDFIKLNSLEFEGVTTANIGEQEITQKVSFATDKESKYFSCTLKVPNSLTVQEIKSDIFEIEQDSEVSGNDTYYYLFLIHNDSNILTYKTINAFEIVLDVSENAVADETIAIEILDDAILADDDGNSYGFTSIEKAEIKINPILSEEITIIGANEIDAPTQYTISVLPENATNQNVEWSVSDETIATISEDGVLTPVKKGNVTVRATAKDGSGVYAEKIVSVKVLGTVNSIITNIGLWDKEYSPDTTNYKIYVPKTTTSIRLTALHEGKLKTDKTTFINNVARTVILSTTSDETVLDLAYTCESYNDNKYTITIIKFEGTKTEVSEDKKSFAITPINIENGKTVILALYNGEQFVKMQSAVYTGEAIPFTTTKSYTKAKVMVWDDLMNLTPICDVETIE